MWIQVEDEWVRIQVEDEWVRIQDEDKWVGIQVGEQWWNTPDRREVSGDQVVTHSRNPPIRQSVHMAY